jgi:hypothetical protein
VNLNDLIKQVLDDLIKQATAARILGVNRAAIAALISRGRLRTVQVDGVPHVYRSEVTQFKKQKPGPKSRTSEQ